MQNIIVQNIDVCTPQNMQFNFSQNKRFRCRTPLKDECSN